MPRRLSRPLDKTVDHLLLAGFVEGDGELVAVDLDDMAVAEFLVEHAIVQRKFRHRAGGFGDQLALDRHRGPLVARKARAELALPAGEGRGILVEAAPGLAAPAAAAVGLRALPARRRIAGTKGFHIVEARRGVAAAPARAALRFGDLDACRRQLVEEARGDRGRPGAVDA